jgi:hypothetical protein
MKVLEIDTMKFVEIYQDDNSDLKTVDLEIGFYEEDGEKSLSTLGNITLNKKELHSLIGLLLHVQSKMK